MEDRLPLMSTKLHELQKSKDSSVQFLEDTQWYLMKNVIKNLKTTLFVVEKRFFK